MQSADVEITWFTRARAWKVVHEASSREQKLRIVLCNYIVVSGCCISWRPRNQV